MEPPPDNPFALLGVPERFDLDRAALDQAYFRLQAASHPDRFIGRPEAERLAALQRSMAVNEAYQALKDPQSRAERLLALRGVVVNSEKHDTVRPGPELLMEMMELGESLDGVSRWEEWIAARRAEIDAAFAAFAGAYEAGDDARAAESVIRVQYLRRLIETAERRAKGDRSEAHRAA